MTTNWGRTTTKKRTTTKRKFSPLLEFSRHPLPPLGHPNRRQMLPIAMLILVLVPGVIPAPAAAAGDQKQTGSHTHDFVIFASVLTEQGFALPGAKVRVRRADEQKFRWEAMSDRRGELGVRVKQGAEYELTVEIHGFKSQTRKIDAREGNQENLTFQMEPLAGGKP
jgi:hypothetical protein